MAEKIVQIDHVTKKYKERTVLGYWEAMEQVKRH